MDHECVIRWDDAHDGRDCRFCGRKPPEVRLGYSKFWNTTCCGQADCPDQPGSTHPHTRAPS